MNNFPKQRLSYKEKVSNDYEWCKGVIDSLLMNHNSEFSTNVKSEYHRMLSNYQLFNNVLNQKDFAMECEPLGLEAGQYEDEVKPFLEDQSISSSLLTYYTLLVHSLL